MALKINLVVTEDLALLKRLYHQHPFYLHNRIQMLYLIKSGVTDSTKELATRLLVVNRVIQRWKNAYLSGGIGQLLKYEKGRHKSNGIITPSISAAIKEALSSPTAGITSYIGLHQWVQANHLPNVSYRVVHHHAKVKLGASLKVGRKSHIKRHVADVAIFKKK
ncbi:MAG: hypothetical protein QM541_06970 [Flavobacterium sp.]|nr:hypothetical protein [Flavobacterium sp.]